MWEGIIFHSRAAYVVHRYNYVLSYIGHKLQTFGDRVSCVEEGSELPYTSPRRFHKAVKQAKKDHWASEIQPGRGVYSASIHTYLEGAAGVRRRRHSWSHHL